MKDNMRHQPHDTNVRGDTSAQLAFGLESEGPIRHEVSETASKINAITQALRGLSPSQATVYYNMMTDQIL